jgi:hypothetical protein
MTPHSIVAGTEAIKIEIHEVCSEMGFVMKALVFVAMALLGCFVPTVLVVRFGLAYLPMWLRPDMFMLAWICGILLVVYVVCRLQKFL